MSREPFRIGLTMAGAVSAGAYTAGVIDYLLEAFEAWDKAKEFGDPSVPQHEVVIEVVSGASAGGIVGTLLLAALLKKDRKLLRRVWVDMVDDETNTTMAKLLDHSDIGSGTRAIQSLLNAKPLEDLADLALAFPELDLDKASPFPPYISPNLDLILTISNLRGLQFKIDFAGNNQDGGTMITNHGGFFRYRVKNQNLPAGLPDGKHLYYVLDLENARDVNYLKSATLATSAFPVGLKARENTVPRAYVKRYAEYLFPNNDVVTLNPINVDDPYEFESVDGGLIHNEPFVYAQKALEEDHKEAIDQKQYALIMVNPFPSFAKQIPDFKGNLSAGDALVKSFLALRRQVMFRNKDIIEALDESDYTRFLIAPVRRETTGESTGQVQDKTLASGALDGFSGFIDQQFRAHDFELGRKNCQSFLGFNFGLPLDQVPQKLNSPVTQAMIERFGYSKASPRKKGENMHFPIVPDVRIKEAFSSTYHTKENILPYPDYPTVAWKKILKGYRKKMRCRMLRITQITVNRMVVNWFIRNSAYKWLIKQIEAGLREKDLIHYRDSED